MLLWADKTWTKPSHCYRMRPFALALAAIQNSANKAGKFLINFRAFFVIESL